MELQAVLLAELQRQGRSLAPHPVSNWNFTRLALAETLKWLVMPFFRFSAWRDENHPHRVLSNFNVGVSLFMLSSWLTL